MWEQGISVGCVLMYGLWGTAFMLIGTGSWFDESALGQVGLALSALAAALTVMRDNQRTRRMLARSGEKVASLHH